MPCLFFLVKLGNKRHSFCSHPLGKAGIIWPCTNSRGSWIGGWPSLLMGWCELCYVGEPGDAFAVWYLSMRIGALHYQPEQPPRAFYFRIERFLKHYYTTFTVIKYHLTLHKVYYLTPFCWNYRIFSVLCHHRVFHEYTSFFNLSDDPLRMNSQNQDYWVKRVCEHFMLLVFVLNWFLRRLLRTGPQRKCAYFSINVGGRQFHISL